MINETERIKDLKRILIELDYKTIKTNPFSIERKRVVEEIHKYGSELFSNLINNVENLETIVYRNEWHISHTKDKFASWCDYSIVEQNILKIEKEYAHDTELIAEILLDKPIIETENKVLERRIGNLNFKINNVNAELNKYNNEKARLLEEHKRIITIKNNLTNEGHDKSE